MHLEEVYLNVRIAIDCTVVDFYFFDLRFISVKASERMEIFFLKQLTGFTI